MSLVFNRFFFLTCLTLFAVASIAICAELLARCYMARRGLFQVWPPFYRVEMELSATALRQIRPRVRFLVNSLGSAETNLRQMAKMFSGCWSWAEVLRNASCLIMTTPGQNSYKRFWERA